MRVTPAPAQPRLEVWGAGLGLSSALERALGYLADAEADPVELARAVGAAEASPAAIGAPRARREPLDDADVARRRLARRARSGRTGRAWRRRRRPRRDRLARRPRVQLDELTPGLEAFWDAARPWERGAI